MKYNSFMYYEYNVDIHYKYLKLLDWIPLEKLDFEYLSLNPNAIFILEKNINKINWYLLSKNPNAIDLLNHHINKIDWYSLSTNPNAIFYFRFTKIKTPYKFFIHEKFIIYWVIILTKFIGEIYQKIQMH